MRNLAGIFFFLFLFFPLVSIANEVDSLKNLLETSDTDYQRMAVMTDLIRAYAKVDMKAALPVAEQGISLAKKVESDTLLGDFLISHGAINVNLGNVEAAQRSFDEALGAYQRINHKEGIANVLERIIYVETYKRSNYDLALDYSFQALKIYEDLELEYDQLIIYGKIADILSKQKNIEESNEWATKMLEKGEAGNYSRIITTALSNLAANYKKTGEYDKAVDYYRRMIEIYEDEKEIVRLAIAYSNLTTAFIPMKKYEQALSAINKSYEYSQKSGFAVIYPTLAFDKGTIFYKKKNYQKAIENLTEAVKLSKESTNASNLPEIYGTLSKSYEAMGNYEKAFENFKLRTALNDSLFNADKELIINELNTKYETEQKEQEIALLSEKEKTQAAQITAARNRNFLLLGLLGMLLLGGGVFYYRRQLNEQLRLQNMRSQISSDLHDEVGSSLAQLSMIMGSVEGSDPASAKSYLQKGNEILSSSISKIRDVVWAIDAKNDASGSLLDRMEDFAYDMLSAKNIKYEISNQGFDRNTDLPPLIRQNFYLFFKEAITNIYKHSDATNVQIDFVKNGKNLSLKIADNGKDLNDKKVTGSGIENMKLRAKKINGNFEFDKNGDGFIVLLEGMI